MCAPCAACEAEKGLSASPNTPKTSPDTMPAAAPVDPCQPNKCACHATSPRIIQKSTAPLPAQGLDPQCGPVRPCFANNGASSKALQAAHQPAPEKEARVGAAQHHSMLWSAARGLSQHRPLQAATSAHAWLASHDGPSWQPDTPGIELRCCCVATSAQRFWTPLV